MYQRGEIDTIEECWNWNDKLSMVVLLMIDFDFAFSISGKVYISSQHNVDPLANPPTHL